jgi:phosphoglycerate dehydrogenase-like enzyme
MLSVFVLNRSLALIGIIYRGEQIMSEVRTIKKVLSTLNWAPAHWEKLEAFLAPPPPEIVHINHYDTAAILEAIEDADVVLLGGDISREMLQAAKRVKWIHCDHAGLNASNHPEIFERSIILTSSSGRSAPVLAEHVFFLMLGLVYDSRLIETHQRSHIWKNISEGQQKGLITRTMGVIGLGKTGVEVIKRGKAFGMRMLAYTRSARDEIPDGIEKVYCQEKGEPIDDLLRESDIVVLTTSLSDKTYHLIDKRAFSLMKPTAFLVNLSRGSVVDEKALYQALIGKQIAGAGSDVFENEPLPVDSPLWDLPNMIITSHSTPAVADRNGFSLQVICDNIMAFREGRPLRNQQDKRDIYTKDVM